MLFYLRKKSNTCFECPTHCTFFCHCTMRNSNKYRGVEKLLFARFLNPNERLTSSRLFFDYVSIRLDYSYLNHTHAQRTSASKTVELEESLCFKYDLTTGSKQYLIRST